MLEEYICMLLESERGSCSNRQENAEPDVTLEEKTAEMKIPKKYKEDIESLKRIYQEDFKTGFCISLTLQEALRVIPRERKRIDAYQGLVSFLRKKMKINLIITSQKTKED